MVSISSMLPGNRIYQNNFVDNTDAHAYVAILGCSNSWDDGYPSGGNYWSGYTGPDYYSGPDQDQPGCDGIVDKAYVIDENNVDRYPLMNRNQYDWPMYGYGPACTSFSLSMAPDTNATAWVTALLGGTVWAYPVVAGGKVFIGAGGYLNAFDKNMVRFSGGSGRLHNLGIRARSEHLMAECSSEPKSLDPQVAYTL